MSKTPWSPSSKATDLDKYPSKKAKNRAKKARKRARARLAAAGRNGLSATTLDALIEADPSLGAPFQSQPPRKKKTDFKSFYQTTAWKTLRYATLERHGGRCQACGISAREGALMQVDHIVPVSVDWSKRLDPENMQVMCASCNWGKGSRYSTDWRPKPVTLTPRAPTDDEIHRGNPFLH